ncbi:hypothetical protein CRUP_004506 [Coryphaenoides rupestris]|nr:hypothetical protein CRUP_004506 [Coryphaenoides rupestris]
MVTGAKDSLPEATSGRLTEGVRVIFDQDLKSHSASRSSSDCSDSGHGSRPRDTHRGRHRSSSSNSSLYSSSRPRSRSHPRCHRNSSRCRCASHDRKAHGHRRRRSPSRRSRAHRRHRSCSSSASPIRSSRRRSHRSRPRSDSQRKTSRGIVGSGVSKSSSKSYRSRSRSPRRPAASPTLDEKRELLRTRKEHATDVLGVDLPESMNPVPDEPSEECPTPEPQEWVPSEECPTPEPQAWVRPEAVPEKAQSQNSDVEPDDFQRSKVSPLRRNISFSIHNSVAKPTVATVASAKVTPRVDGIESRKPYGHWVPIRRGGLARKRSSR